MLAALAALVAYLPARAQAPASGPAAIDGIVQVADRAFRMSIPSGDARMFAAVHLAAGSAPAPTVVFRTGHLSGHGPSGPTPRWTPIPTSRSSASSATAAGTSWPCSTAATGAAPAGSRTPTCWPTPTRWWRTCDRAASGRALQVDGARVALLGSSMGGGAALLAAGHVPGRRCVAALAPFNMGAFLEAAQAKGDSRASYGAPARAG